MRREFESGWGCVVGRLWDSWVEMEGGARVVICATSLPHLPFRPTYARSRRKRDLSVLDPPASASLGRDAVEVRKVPECESSSFWCNGRDPLPYRSQKLPNHLSPPTLSLPACSLAVGSCASPAAYALTASACFPSPASALPSRA